MRVTTALARTLVAVLAGVAAVPLAATGVAAQEEGSPVEGVPSEVLVLVGAGVAVLALLLLAMSLWANARVRRRARRARAFIEVRAVSEQDLVALASDLRNLEVGLAHGQDHPRARRYYDAAFEHYERAMAAFERARWPRDLAGVSTSLEAGRFALETARAYFERRPAPRRRPPCFFDTRHGPSVDDVGWLPRRGTARPVPACPLCRDQVESGVEPAAREVLAEGRSVPFYDAPGYFESWFGGYFGGMAVDLVEGFELGKALDDGFAGGINTFGGGYGYLPPTFAETGAVDTAGAVIGEWSHDARPAPRPRGVRRLLGRGGQPG